MGLADPSAVDDTGWCGPAVGTVPRREDGGVTGTGRCTVALREGRSLPPMGGGARRSLRPGHGEDAADIIVTRDEVTGLPATNAIPAVVREVRRTADACRVRSMSGDLGLSALITQPALRITMTPKVNTINTNKSGIPSAAIHSADNVGHNNNKIPMGLSKRIS